jgi:glycosyltransferase involved in cell wall biosynthesis
MPKILIAVATYRRPKGLARLLDALERLDTAEQVEILVADNDEERGEGLAFCDTVRANGYRWPLHTIVARERGIAQARNALVAYALDRTDAGFVAMLDDDEWPAPGWLDAFLRVQREMQSDALHGAVLREFDVPPGGWAAHCQGIAPLRHRSGPVAMIHGTSNVFFTRACLLRLDRPWFDPGFALTGGEDKEFFTRLKRQGARFAWADDAVVFAHVPASRANLGWALRRAYRVGNSDMRVFLKHERRLGALSLEAAKIAAALFLSPAQIALSAPWPARRTAALCRLWRSAGKFAAVMGAHFNEYATIHGG